MEANRKEITLSEVLDVINSIQNRCEVVNILYVSGYHLNATCDFRLYHTLIEDIYEDAQYLMDEFCREEKE